MPELTLDGSVYLDLHRKQAAAGDLGLSKQPINIQFVKDGEVLQEQELPVPDLDYQEAFAPGGGIACRKVPGPIELPEVPEGTDTVQFFAGFTHLGSHPLAALESRTENPFAEVAPRIFPEGSNGGGLDFPVFSERFLDEERFYSFASRLYDFLIGFPPFDEFVGTIRILAYFAQAPDGVGGWFDTFDKSGSCDPSNTEVVLGNNVRASEWLKDKFYLGKFGLVLFDSPKRGGGGGQEKHLFPAWASTTACPGEHWEAVAVHEIGHALGLCDEYVWTGRAHENPQAGEPNVAITGNTSAVSWHLKVNRPGDPTWDKTDHPPFDTGAVGTYRGCRYREDLYRPSPHCIMRGTTIPFFCPVCSDHLRTKLRNL